jgi:hypothetical protein
VTALVIAPPGRGDIAIEVRRIREAAQVRYSEVDLLVATLKDHIRDLQRERDHLRAQLAMSHEARRLESAAWLQRGQKPVRCVVSR